MASIKIAELQYSNLCEELSVADLEAVKGGTSIPGAQFTGSTSGAIVGVAIGGGSTTTGSQSFSQLDGVVGNFNVRFGTQTFGFTTP